GDVEADAGVAFAAVPIAPVPRHVEQGAGDLIGGGFQFLEADNVGMVTIEPLLDFRKALADAIYIPGCDAEFWHLVIWLSGHFMNCFILSFDHLLDAKNDQCDPMTNCER